MVCQTQARWTFGLLLMRLASGDRLIQQKIENQITALLTTEGGAYVNAIVVLNCYATYRRKFKDKSVTFLNQYDGTPKVEDYGLIAMLENRPQVIQNAFLDRGPKLATYLTERLPKLSRMDRATIMRLFVALPDTNLRISPKRSEPLKEGFLVPTSTLVADYALLEEVFRRPVVTEACRSLVNSLPPPHWHIAAYLRDIARMWYARRVTG